MDNVIPLHGRQAKKLAVELSQVIDGRDLATVLEALGILTQGLCVTVENMTDYPTARSYKIDLLNRIIEYTKDY